MATLRFCFALILFSVVARGQIVTPPPAYFELSAYRATGDSTVIWTPELPSVVFRVLVVIDSSWTVSDSLGIGQAGTKAQRPKEVWASTAVGRGSVDSVTSVYLNAASVFGVHRSLVLYHVLVGGDPTGRIRVYIWFQPIDYANAVTLFKTE